MQPPPNGGPGGKAPQLRLFSCLDSLCSPPKTPHSQRVPLGCRGISVTYPTQNLLWGGFKGFPHTITYSTMHFKQFQDDLVKKKKKNRCGALHLTLIVDITVNWGDLGRLYRFSSNI